MNYQDIIGKLQDQDTVDVHVKDDRYISYKLNYELGGYSYFTGEETRRGYYLIVMPMEKSNGFVRFGMFDGIKAFVSPQPIKRKSAKARKEALENVTEELLDRLTKEVTQ